MTIMGRFFAEHPVLFWVLFTVASATTTGMNLMLFVPAMFVGGVYLGWHRSALRSERRRELESSTYSDDLDRYGR